MHKPILPWSLGALAAACVVVCCRGAALEPGVIIHHGYDCQSTPCLSITHQSHAFGTAMAGIRGQRVVIGAPGEGFAVSNRQDAVDAGAVFVYRRDGTVEASIGNPDPRPGDRFGAAVVAVNNGNAFVVAAPAKDVLSPSSNLVANVGAAYVYALDGTRTATLAHPFQSAAGAFGSAVSPLGSNAVLVGATGTLGGVVWSFSLAGTLLAEFAAPGTIPGDRFGGALAEINPTLVAIGAPGRDANQPDSGVVHLFQTFGAFLGTIPNPAPGVQANFGAALAALSPNLFAVGAPGIDTVFVYNAGGNLQTAIENPFPGEAEAFGRSLLALSDDRLLIGAWQSDGGGSPAGRAFLYDAGGVRLLSLDIAPAPATPRPAFGAAFAPLGADGFVVSDPGGDTFESNAGSVYFFRDLGLVSRDADGAGFSVSILAPGTLGCLGRLACLEPSAARIEDFGSVTWSNLDADPHRLVSGTPPDGPDGCFDTGAIAPGTSYQQVFDDQVAGTLDYYCTMHPGETATIRVDINDGPTQAIVAADAVREASRVDEAGDEEWMQFLAVPDADYEIAITQAGGQVDTVLEVYYQLADGSLSNVSGTVNAFGRGIGLGESYLLSAPPAGIYFARITYVDQGVYGDGTGSDFTVGASPVGAGAPFLVGAVDYVTLTAPAGAVASIANLGLQSSFPAGEASVLFQNLPAGTHSFAVTADAGILPLQSTLAPFQSLNPANASFGNPRQIHVGAVGDPGAANFYFQSAFTVSGMVADQWTGVALDGAALTFQATSGAPAAIGTVYSRYPHGAWYAPAWTTQDDGSFPPGMIMPTISVLLRATRPGYEDYVAPASIAAPAAGQHIDVGTIYMVPVDQNGNGIADLWESTVAPGCPLPADGDKDGDHATNREEYLAGTDPLDPESVFALHPALTASGLGLTWPLAEGRTYAVQSAQQPSGEDAWLSETSPMPADEFGDGWTDPLPLPDTGKAYRVELILP
jgi:hypothetical protein